MYKITLFCWHGAGKDIHEKILKLFPNAVNIPNTSSYEFPEKMSLDESYRVWDDKFMLIKDSSSNDEVTICITLFSSFGQR